MKLDLELWLNIIFFLINFSFLRLMWQLSNMRLLNVLISIYWKRNFPLCMNPLFSNTDNLPIYSISTIYQITFWYLIFIHRREFSSGGRACNDPIFVLILIRWTFWLWLIDRWNVLQCLWILWRKIIYNWVSLVLSKSFHLAWCALSFVMRRGLVRTVHSL